MNKIQRYLHETTWQEHHEDLKVPLIGIFAASVVVAISHGLVSVVVTPHYWAGLMIMVGISVLGFLPNWRRLSALWRIPLFLVSTVYATLMLLYSGKLSYVSMLYIVPVVVGALMMRGPVRYLLQGVTVLLGSLVGSRLHPSVPWDWIITLVLMTLSANYLIDRILLAVHREVNRARHYQVIGETTKLLLHRSDNDMLERFCRQALAAFGATQCVLFLANEKGTELETRALALKEGVSHEAFIYFKSTPIDKGLTGWVYLNGEPVHSDDAARDPRALAGPHPLPGSGIFLPVLASSGSPMGVLRLYKPGLMGFSPEDFELAKLWAREVGLVLQRAELNQRLERMALTDALTGLYNRHYLSQRWPTVVEESSAQGLPVALLMMDCFNFKQINDRYGHTVGDQLLHKLGQFLLRETPDGGFAVRYGGDEFVIILPNTTLQQAVEMKQVLEYRLSLGAVAEPDGPSLTVGIGVYAAEGEELVQLLTQVDTDLYEESDRASYQRLQALLEHSVSERTKHMVQAVMSLTKIQEINDPYTRGHSERAKEISLRTAKRLGMTPEEIQVVGFGAMLHDVGKVVVPPEILHKPGPLTSEEWHIMRMHPIFGANIVGELDSLKPVKPLILHHHERWDGLTEGDHPGYPAGLKGEEIPLGARIIAVVDAFDTMITDRIYRQGQSVEYALAELRRMAGRQFDPDVVEAFDAVVREMQPEWLVGLQMAGHSAVKPARPF